MPSAAASSCSRCWRCGCSSASACRSPPPASYLLLDRAAARPSPISSRRASPRRIGLVNTMVFTHLPSNILLILVPFAPNLRLALALLLVRSALSQMDVPTRTSYVMAVVTPAERAAAASVTAVPRSLAAAVEPARSPGMLLGALDLRLAAGRRRRAQDRLRPAAARALPPPPPAGGAAVGRTRRRLPFVSAPAYP